LGIELYCGKNRYDITLELSDDNFISIYNLPKNSLNVNIDANKNYFQTRTISKMLYRYLQSKPVKSQIISKNPFADRYNANNDLCLHIRLTDVEHYNPGAEYFLSMIKYISHDNLFIATDDFGHQIISEIMSKYPYAIIIHFGEIQTIQFASTCKNVVLSHGSFSAIIGYLSFYSMVYYYEYELNKIWYGDMFSNNNWVKISHQANNKFINVW
jgi:hypothetical protein